MTGRPHYLPEIVWMGCRISFTGGKEYVMSPSETAIRKWASARDDLVLEDRIFWSIAIPEDTVVLRAEAVDEIRVEQVYP